VDEVMSSFDQLGHERLRRIKAFYDPDNLFRVNRNITPAT
jgi:FAD/FMN-containing dehydrogenase